MGSISRLELLHGSTHVRIDGPFSNSQDFRDFDCWSTLSDPLKYFDFAPSELFFGQVPRMLLQNHSTGIILA
jgi:hypothetical protein